MGDATTLAIQRREEQESLDLPPGFRFHPTDEEIITYYLTPKVLSRSFVARAIGEVDLNKCEPWDLPSKAKMGEKEWYFFCQKDRKYPTGMRTNRATEAGYWKATGKDKEIFKGRGLLVGMKKTLVFYRGRAPKGEKTNWVMHEYRLEGRLPYLNNSSLRSSSKDEWVVCRIFHKSVGVKKMIPMMGGMERSNSIGEDYLVDSNTLPPLMDPSFYAAGSSGGGARPGASYVHDAGTSSASASSYLAALVGFENHAEMNVSQFGMASAVATAANPAAYYQQPGPYNLPIAMPTASLAYFQQEEQAVLRALAAGGGPSSAIRPHCKAEQLSASGGGGQTSMVSRSQDTGLSSDQNATAEISSVLSGRYNADDQLDGPPPPPPPPAEGVGALELDGMWMKY